MKKILFSMICTLLPMVAWCEDGDVFQATTVEGVTMTFKVISESERTCQVGNGSSDNPAISSDVTGTVTIPAMANGMSVIRIAGHAFEHCMGVEEIVIPSTVSEIFEAAFMESGITTMTLPNSLTMIAEGAFDHCMNLTAVHSQITKLFEIPSVFIEYTYSNATLYVPIGMLQAYNDSETWGLFLNKVEESQVAQPTFTYNGHFLTISHTEPTASIYYTLDESDPTTSSTPYTEPIAIFNTGPVKAIAVVDDQPSSVAVYDVRYFFDGTTAWCEEPGMFEHCFDWCNLHEDVDSLIIMGVMEPSDFSLLHSMDNLWYLDMRETNIMNESLPQGAFANSNLKVFISPYYLNEAGANLFANCSKLAAVVWNANIELPASALDGVTNPNLLVYVTEGGYAPAGITNLVIGDLAENIVLSDVTEGYNDFFCPQWFKAEKISYTRQFNMETEIGVSRGWESICLPFDVQKITHETNGDLAPFNSSILTGKPFWLRGLADYGLENAQTILADKPYIISMPNNPTAYTSEYNQAGKVTFSAVNVEIPPTYLTAYYYENIALIPTYRSLPSTGIYAINRGEARGSFKEGSVFELNYREVRPFEAYTRHYGLNPAPRYIPVSTLEDESSTGIEEVLATVGSQALQQSAVYNLAGQRVEKPGKGLYIVNGKKVIIK